jgi:hypothetical protein
MSDFEKCVYRDLSQAMRVAVERPVPTGTLWKKVEYGFYYAFILAIAILAIANIG